MKGIVIMLFIIDQKKFETASVWDYQELEAFNSPTDGTVCFLMKNDNSILRFKNFFVRQDKTKGWRLSSKKNDKDKDNKQGKIEEVEKDKILLHKYFDVVTFGSSVLMYPVMDFFGFFGGFVTENTQKICDKYPELLEPSVEYKLIDDEELILYSVRVFSAPRLDFFKNPDGFLVVKGKTQRLFLDGNNINCSDNTKGKIKIDPMAERLMKLVL